MSLYRYWYNFKNKLNINLKIYWYYRPNRWYLLISLILQIIIWFFSYRLFRAIGSDLFVSHYNVDFGIDGVGSSQRAFWPAILALVVFFLNSILMIVVSKNKHFHFFVHASGLSCIFVQILSILTLMSLYLINFFA